MIGIGSRDPITRRQLDYLLSHREAQLVLAPGGQLPPIGLTGDLTVLATDTEDDSASVVGQRFATGLASLIRRQHPAALLLSGGETAQAVLAELDVDLLDVGGDLLPGCPCSRFQLDGAAILLVTKSGGFGRPETIAILAASPTPDAASSRPVEVIDSRP